MKIIKQNGPARKQLGDLKTGALFERADVEVPHTTYMVTKIAGNVSVSIDGLPCDHTYVTDLRNSTFKAFADTMEVIPLEQNGEIVVREF